MPSFKRFGHICMTSRWRRHRSYPIVRIRRACVVPTCSHPFGSSAIIHVFQPDQCYKWEKKNICFSEPSVVINIKWAIPTWYTIFLNQIKLSSTWFVQINMCSSSGGLYRQIKVYSSRWKDTTYLMVSASRILIRCKVKHCKLLMQMSRHWTIICMKHVEDNLIEIHFKEKVCILMVLLA
jgi:hypothetical protein